MKIKAICICLTLLIVLPLAFYGCAGQFEETGENTEYDTKEDTKSMTEPETTEPEKPSDNVYTLTEKDGKATVRSGDLSYTASGYESISDNKFIIKSGFTADFENEFDKFNRVTIKYAADKAIKISVKYKIDDAEKNEPFFMEAAENGQFSFIIGTYFEADLGQGKISVSAETCTGEEADFVIFGIEPEDIGYSGKTVRYIESSRYKLGIKLTWGGAVCYLEDKNVRISGLKNLINQHDTGRLLQQSYYGTYGNDEFTPGTSFGVSWRYNPVQGGDQYGHESRIIDMRFDEDGKTAYIKCQPLDWAKSNYFTPFYMEDTYTVTDEYIKVDNRFVDFSGWEHPAAGQEIPALYIVSYFSRFVYYAGENSWQDDELTYKDDLPFWGPYPAETTFLMKGENTEIWGAFFNPEDNFGIGLYTPNIDKLGAGRYNYDGSKNSASDSTNVIGGANTLKIVSFKPVEYSYLVTTGSVDEIRAMFKKNKDFAKNEDFNGKVSMRIGDAAENDVIITFDDENNLGRFLNGCHNTEVVYSHGEKAAALICRGGDPHLAVTFTSAFEAESRRHIEFEYMLPKENGMDSYTTELFLCAGETTKPAAGKSVFVDLVKDGGYHTATVDLTDLPFWSGLVHKIRFDFFTGGESGDTMYVRSFKLLP